MTAIFETLSDCLSPWVCFWVAMKENFVFGEMKEDARESPERWPNKVRGREHESEG